MVEKKQDDSFRRQVEEAQRSIREDWPDWMRRNRDAVHVPIQSPKENGTKPKSQ